MMTTVNALIVVDALERHRPEAGPLVAESVGISDAVAGFTAFVGKRPEQREAY